MGSVQHDDGFSDDDLDALPEGTFQQMQENAVIFTQQAAREKQTSLPAAARPQNKAPTVLAQGLERLSVSKDVPSYALQAESNFPNQPSSDYGDMDDDMLDGEIYDAADEPGVDAIQASRAASLPHAESTQREQWRDQRNAMPPKQLHSNTPQLPAEPQMRNARDGNLPKTEKLQESVDNGDTTHGGRQSDRDALEAQILELRREKQAAEDAALAKSGEIAIIRANQKKLEKKYESEMQALKKLHVEEAARQKIEVERALAEKQKITTEKGFLQNDLAEVNEQNRSLQRAVKAKSSTSRPDAGKDDGRSALPTTPKKNKSLNHGDGFEEDEIQVSSPYKLPTRSKNNTPKAGNKRKRKAVETSPIKPLQLGQAKAAPEISDRPDHTPTQPANVTDSDLPPSKAFSATALLADRFELTQHVMNHRIEIGGKRTFEAMSDFSYPSKPDTALSTIFLDEMSNLSAKGDIENFPVALALIILSMWKQCVDEQFWGPVHLFLDLTRFVLCMSPATTGPLVVEKLLEAVQSTADVNIIPRIRRQPPKFSAKVNTLDCLELLKSVSYDCLFREEDIILFWKRMRFDFIAMILQVVQPIEELHVSLALLRTSVQKESFAMIVPLNDGKQEPSEMRLLELLTRLLVEQPKPPKADEPYGVVEIAKLRLSVLSLMEEMCDNKHGCRMLASSEHAIGRLVWVMNDELDALYDYRYGHEYRAELVNQATRLLFRLKITHPELINMQEKLKIIPNSGGVHKHLIALTRLALSEGVFFEEEIEDDVVECAYEMLEDLSSPEEAEALREAFSTARSR
ncbi:MAG: hypothetical protein Q9200_001829 [Gallowayella weberi]